MRTGAMATFGRPWCTGVFVATVAVLVTAAQGAGATSEAAPTDVCGSNIQELMEYPSRWSAAAQSSGGLGWCDCFLNSKSGYTPLHELASLAGSGVQVPEPGILAAFARKLVKGGSRVLARDARNSTALHIAAATGAGAVAAGIRAAAHHLNLVPPMLLALDGHGMTPLQVAEGNGQLAVAKMLLDWGGDRSVRADNRSNACTSGLLTAVLLADAQVVRQALAHETASNEFVADCRVQGGSKGWTLLHYAAAASELSPRPKGAEIVQVILDYGANASAPDSAGDLPLATAAHHDQKDVVTLLLRDMRPGEIDATDARGRSALHKAVAAGSVRSTKLLLASGASPYLPDDTQTTPAQLAEQNGHAKVIEAIVHAMADPLYGVSDNLNTFITDAGESGQLVGGSEEADSDSSLLHVSLLLVGTAIAISCSVVFCCWIHNGSAPVWMYASTSSSKVAALPEGATTATVPATPVRKATNGLSSTARGAGTRDARRRAPKVPRDMEAPPGHVASDSTDDSDGSPPSGAARQSLGRSPGLVRGLGLEKGPVDKPRPPSVAEAASQGQSSPTIVKAESRGSTPPDQNTGTPAASQQTREEEVNRPALRTPFRPPAAAAVTKPTKRQPIPDEEVMRPALRSPFRPPAVASAAPSSSIEEVLLPALRNTQELQAAAPSPQSQQVVLPKARFVAPGRSAATANPGDAGPNGTSSSPATPAKRFPAPGRAAADGSGGRSDAGSASRLTTPTGTKPGRDGRGKSPRSGSTSPSPRASPMNSGSGATSARRTARGPEPRVQSGRRPPESVM